MKVSGCREQAMKHRKMLLFCRAEPGTTPHEEPIRKPFAYPSLPRQIQKHSAGLGLYFRTLNYFMFAMLVLTGLAVYPILSNLKADAFTNDYTLIAAAGESQVCPKGYGVRLPLIRRKGM
jgi:hypothetical protein